MYRTKVKEEFQDGFYKDDEYIVICDMNGGDKALVFNPNTMLLSDIYRNKLVESRKETILDTVFVVKAKKEQYEIEFNMEGMYIILNGVKDKVLIKELYGEKTKEIFPSRLIVVNYDGMED